MRSLYGHKKQSPAFGAAFSVRIPCTGANKRRMEALTKLTYKIFDHGGARVVQTKVNSGDATYTTKRMSVARTINAIIPDDNDSFVLSRLNKNSSKQRKAKKRSGCGELYKQCRRQFSE